MSTSLRARLAKLEQQIKLFDSKSVRKMSDAELCSELNSLLERARQVVLWHANHPEGINGPYINTLAVEEVTLEMIAQSEHVDEGWRFAARTLIEAGIRKQQNIEGISQYADRTPL